MHAHVCVFKMQECEMRDDLILKIPIPSRSCDPAPTQQPHLHPSSSSSDVSPAWRGTHPWQQQQQQPHPDSRRPPQDHRVLFDPKHPEKPLPGRMMAQQVIERELLFSHRSSYGV